jgi:hypothetical protein
MQYSMTNALDRMIWEAQSWRDAMVSILRDVTRAFTREFLIRPFVQAAVGTQEQPGWLPAMRQAFVGAFSAHTGGLVADLKATRLLPAAIAENAPRYHQGYLKGNEKVGIFEDQEMILPAGVKPARVSAGDVTVVVNNKTPLAARAGPVRADGRRYTVDLVLEALTENPKVRSTVRRVARS